jgi:uncharacterized membrane protein YhaH (DUF805 family)
MGRWFLNFSFDGRAPRSHQWANSVAWAAIIIGLILAIGSAAGYDAVSATTAVLVMSVAVALGAIDNMAATFRRAHDTSRSGFVWVLLLIPLVNLLPLFWLLIEDSQAGPNKYGPPVKMFYEPPAPPSPTAA